MYPIIPEHLQRPAGFTNSDIEITSKTGKVKIIKYKAGVAKEKRRMIFRSTDNSIENRTVSTADFIKNKLKLGWNHQEIASELKISVEEVQAEITIKNLDKNEDQTF